MSGPVLSVVETLADIGGIVRETVVVVDCSGFLPTGNGLADVAELAQGGCEDIQWRRDAFVPADADTATNGYRLPTQGDGSLVVPQSLLRSGYVSYRT